MADEKTFRPQRKSVTPSDVEASGMESMQAAQSIRDAAASEVGEEASHPGGGFEIQGNMPPGFQAALNRNRGQETGDYGTNRDSKMSPNRRPSAPIAAPNAGMRVSGSAKLEELIANAKKNFVTWEELKLPSRGVFYNGDDGPTDGVINVRPMTGEEEQILATPRFVKKGQAVNMIFNRCIKEGFDSNNFLTADRTYLLIFLRGISYSPDYDVEVKCPFTDKQFTTTINLASLFLEQCPLNYGVQNLQGVLPTTGYKFTFRLPTGSDEQRIQEYRDHKAKFDVGQNSDDTLIYRTSLLLHEIEGLTDKSEIQELLRHLPIGDVAHLRNSVNEPPFGVDTKVGIISPFTMEEFELELPLEANFFFPKARKTNQSTTQA